MTTSTPPELLLSYLTGELTPDETNTFEEDLFAGKLDQHELTELSTVLVGVREAAFLGILNVVVPPEHADEMRANGYRVVHYRMEPGVPLDAEVYEDCDLFFVEYVVDLTGVSQVISETCDAQGRPFKRTTPLSVTPGAQSMSGYCARDLALASARALPDGLVVKLYAVEGDGERLIGEYFTRMLIRPTTPAP
jgi:hypothetical protein